MNTVGIILASLLGGILFVLLVGGLTVLIVLHLRLLKEVGALKVSLVEFSADIEGELDKHRTEIGGTVESARTSFTGIRQEIKAGQAEQTKALNDLVEGTKLTVLDALGKINATAMETAAIRGTQACIRMERVANLLQTLLVTHDAPNPGAELGPEEYGPSDGEGAPSIYEVRSPAARGDDAALESEAEEMAPRFSIQPTEV